MNRLNRHEIEEENRLIRYRQQHRGLRFMKLWLPPPTYREVNLVGEDNHIYKGTAPILPVDELPPGVNTESIDMEQLFQEIGDVRYEPVPEQDESYELTRRIGGSYTVGKRKGLRLVPVRVHYSRSGIDNISQERSYPEKLLEEDDGKVQQDTKEKPSDKYVRPTEVSLHVDDKPLLSRVSGENIIMLSKAELNRLIREARKAQEKEEGAKREKEEKARQEEKDNFELEHENKSKQEEVEEKAEQEKIEGKYIEQKTVDDKNEGLNPNPKETVPRDSDFSKLEEPVSPEAGESALSKHVEIAFKSEEISFPEDSDSHQPEETIITTPFPLKASQSVIFILESESSKSEEKSSSVPLKHEEIIINKSEDPASLKMEETADTKPEDSSPEETVTPIPLKPSRSVLFIPEGISRSKSEEKTSHVPLKHEELIIKKSEDLKKKMEETADTKPEDSSPEETVTPIPLKPLRSVLFIPEGISRSKSEEKTSSVPLKHEELIIDKSEDPAFLKTEETTDTKPGDSSPKETVTLKPQDSSAHSETEDSAPSKPKETRGNKPEAEAPSKPDETLLNR